MGLYARGGKRLADAAAALVLLAILSPLLLAVAGVILAKDGRPVFFRHGRVGRGQRAFRIWKFRTMVRGADRAGPHYTDAGDPRVTRWGATLRKYSLDELPQVFNVLAGQMSLVGPRPDTRLQIDALAPEAARKRCSVRPGMTGLAQCSGRSTLAAEERLAYDLAYADGVSLRHDLRILWKTAAAVLRGEGSW